MMDFSMDLDDLETADEATSPGTALATIEPNTALASARSEPKLTSPQKAAVVLVALGPESASALLNELGSPRLRRFAQILNDLPRISNEAVDEVLAEFLDRLEDTQSVQGGKEETRRFLSGVLEKDQVNQIMTDLESSRRSVWSSLSDVDDQRIAIWLEGEHPQVAAIALSQLTSVKAARVLEKFDAETAQEIVLRLAQASAASPEVATRIGEVVEREFLPRARKSQSAQDPSVLIGSMMNHIAPKVRDSLLTYIGAEEPSLAESVQRVMFTFENIVDRVQPRDASIVAKSVDEMVMLKAFKSDDEIGKKTAEFFFGNMSKRLAERLREDLETLETPKAKDRDAARAEMVAVVVGLRDRGEIEMIEDDGDDE